MNTLILVAVFSLLGLLLLEAYCTQIFLNLFNKDEQYYYQDDELPKVAVILCLRGADPFLDGCLQALLNQNYPQYELKIIVDSEGDPAWKVVKESIPKTTNVSVKVSPLKSRHKTCSLKCSSLIQAVNELNSDCEIIAFVDADAMPHKNWLRELVHPFKNPQVGSTTGNLWYVPGKQWGTLCRYVWNVAAVGQMYLYRIPWGGTLAIRKDVISETKLLKKWKQSFGEDTMLPHVMKEKGLQIKPVPSLFMVNREECSLLSFGRWVSRQFLTTKLYHPGWNAVLVYSLITSLIPLLTGFSIIVALLTKRWTLAIIMGSAFIFYTLILFLLIGFWERAIRAKLMLRNEVLPQYSVFTQLKCFLAIPLTQLVCAIALWRALLTKQIEWRGITYKVKGAWNIELLEYLPYQAQSKNSKASL